MADFKFTIIIPVYNVEKYIVRCLDSVAKQTWKGQIECILVDDCGPDNSALICEEYVNNYSGNVDFKLVHRKENGGLSAARNTGIEASTGDYIYFLDSDDELPQNAVELLSNEVDRHPGIDVVMGFMYDDRHSAHYSLDCYKDHQYTTDTKWLQYKSFCQGKIIPVNGCNKLLRRRFVLDNKLYFKPGIIHEDNHWMFYLVKSVKSWAFVFEPTYIRYWNEGSIMTSTNDKKEAWNWFAIMLDHCKNLYEPVYALQLSFYLNRFFALKMYEYHIPKSSVLHLNFIRCCIKKHLWKGACLMCLWSLLYAICPKRNGFRVKLWMRDYSCGLYKSESDNWNSIYGQI